MKTGKPIRTSNTSDPKPKAKLTYDCDIITNGGKDKQIPIDDDVMSTPSFINQREQLSYRIRRIFSHKKVNLLL